MQSFRLTMPAKFFIMISAILILPPLGAILQLATFKLEYFDTLHLLCLIPYLAYGIWLRLYWGRRIEVSSDFILVKDWLKQKAYNTKELEKIGEVLMPAQNHATGRFEYISHLYIQNNEGYSFIQEYFINDYAACKSAIEDAIGRPLNSTKIEKSSLLKAIEFFELAS